MFASQRVSNVSVKVLATVWLTQGDGVTLEIRPKRFKRVKGSQLARADLQKRDPPAVAADRNAQHVTRQEFPQAHKPAWLSSVSATCQYTRT